MGSMTWKRRRAAAMVAAALAAVVALAGSGRAGVAAGSTASPQASTQPSGVAILQDLKRFANLGSVLYVAAHPDDENTLLITYLARGRGCRTAYLSLTRGDGGQNVLGPEFGDALGVIRTQELLAARRLDGGRQFFSRAIDFGFSKDYRETLKVWGHDEVLGDVVRIYREFRPDVVITRFSPEPGNTHGHHTASAVLALEAFKISGDPKAYPEQLKQGLTVWQPKRIFQNGRGGEAGDLRFDVNGTDPVLNHSYSQIAARSRSMHRSQGFAGFVGYGGRDDRPRMESFHLLAGAPASKDLFDDIDTTWNRVTDGAPIARGAEELVAKFDPADPAASVDRVLALRKALAGLSVADPVVAEKKRDLDRILEECLGLTVRTTVDHAEVLPGEEVTVHQRVTISSAVPVRWMTVQSRPVEQLRPREAAQFDRKYPIPPGTPVSQPYWLQDESAVGVAKVADPRLIGRPENPPVLRVDYDFEVGGQTLVVHDEPVQLPPAGSAQPPRRMAVIPPVSLSPVGPVELFATGAPHDVAVEIESARADASGVVRLKAPAGWTVAPAEQQFGALAAGERNRVTFTVTAPKEAGTGLLSAEAEVGGG